MDMLARKYDADTMAEYAAKNELVAAQTEQNDREITHGQRKPIYLFDNGVLDGADLEMTDKSIGVKGYQYQVSLDIANPYE
jgi:acetoacetyl-[acyl-carrier protein] synthase